MNPNRLQEVLVAYDVENNRARTRLHNQLRDLGLISIQKSVMWGRLLPAEISLVKRLFAEELDSGTDRALITKGQIKDKASFYGYVPEMEEYDDDSIF
ncbi:MULTISPECIES: CRISPR-associated endonuclease Cas2 [Oceanospirillaceae]|uniref:CRISPR-associated endoribonuclease Cas2 n=1 Tax=Oceanobacter antarcticus TaxID=3133425 RepID=A0ABW8NFJ6_9GAMM|tara:strand:+ start:7645 stop:7938 length:294 start_codon:yes stop_codon:yes gene_type:complete